jgi:ABC-2 type transport system permease protein
MSVGLGAVMPNFRETDPSKIAVGFGGTVNLVVSLMLLAFVVCTVALPMHFVHGRTPDVPVPITAVPWYAWASLAGGVMVGLAAIWLPLRAGMRSLRLMEF